MELSFQVSPTALRSASHLSCHVLHGMLCWGERRGVLPRGMGGGEEGGGGGQKYLEALCCISSRACTSRMLGRRRFLVPYKMP